MEYINQKIVIPDAPSVRHQEICGNLYFMLRKYFEDDLEENKEESEPFE